MPTKPTKKTAPKTSYKDMIVEAIAGLKDRSGRGILLVYPFPPTVIAQLAKRFPVVSTVDQVQTTGIDCVDVNHYDGISRAIENLAAAGHEPSARWIDLMNRRPAPIAALTSAVPWLGKCWWNM